ncbi:G-protein-signaling modulator 2-like [Centruroides sculpturatus]|uniref:G-protein-signaling modulator 2-like n=1 Tax=Centruroides sculpturatus TaxID=218467 RepID=UPI000C6E33D2|nr:G-protein-signaling modulator 2-like [Centruroides sculpturatus]
MAEMDPNTCLELALEGERLCKGGDFRSGVAFFEAAIRIGTDDLRTLSAIYSQLGNAYFYLGDYAKAMEYHKCDLTVARAIGDELGEAKASGNLGNTLKVMEKYDEAIVCCQRHLDISRELNDKIGEGRALYNLGNVYHAKGKHIARTGHQDPGEFPEEVKSCLHEAVKYYEENLKLMIELGDRSAQGRASGNLGNTHYLLGNFEQAIVYHEERLKIAREFGDKSGERRAHSNLGNAHIFLGEFETAADHYKKTLAFAEELGDKAVEAQACYSLGNTYTLLHDYAKAIEYHLRHLRIAQELRDRIGEGRAYWSLGNAHSAIRSHHKALKYAKKHLEISKEIGDQTGELTAQMSICDLQKIIELESITPDSQNCNFDNSRMRRISMENMDLLKLTPDAKKSLDGNKFRDDLFDLIAGIQSRRLDEQRASLPRLPGLNIPTTTNIHRNNNNNIEQNLLRRTSVGSSTLPDDDFFDMLMRCQASRFEDQRSSMPDILPCRSQRSGHYMPTRHSSSPSHCPQTFPDDDFLSLILRFQAGRMEDQRSALPGKSSSPPREENDNCSEIGNTSKAGIKPAGLLRSSLKVGSRKARKYSLLHLFIFDHRRRN